MCRTIIRKDDLTLFACTCQEWSSIVFSFGLPITSKKNETNKKKWTIIKTSATLTKVTLGTFNLKGFLEGALESQKSFPSSNANVV